MALRSLTAESNYAKKAKSTEGEHWGKFVAPLVYVYNNKRVVVSQGLIYNGKEYTMSQLAKEEGTTVSKIRTRALRGMTIEEIMEDIKKG